MKISEVRLQCTTPDQIREFGTTLRARSIALWTTDVAKPQGEVIPVRDPRETLDYLRGGVFDALADILEDLAKVDALVQPWMAEAQGASAATALFEAVRSKAQANITTLQAVLDLASAAEEFRVINKESYATISTWLRLGEEFTRSVVSARARQLKHIEMLSWLVQSMSPAHHS